MITRRSFGGLAMGAVGGSLLPASAFAQAPFFNSSTAVSALIGISPGAGSDIITRYIADFLSKHTEGNPPVIVRNVPGAGGIVAGNQFERSPRDGMTMYVLSSNGWANYLMGNENVAYDLSRVIPIVSVPGNSFLSIRPDTGYTEPADLLTKEMRLVMGGGSVSAGHIRLVMALEILGVADSVNFVWGYGGGGETALAFQRGETTLVSQTVAGYLNSIVPLEESGDAITLFQVGVLGPDGEFMRDPDFPDVPTVHELYVEMHGEAPSGPLYESFKVFGGLVNSLLYSLVAHADCPPEAVAALREGANRMAQDPEFMENALAVFGTENVLVGDALEPQIEVLRNIELETLLVVRRLATEKYGASGLRLE